MNRLLVIAFIPLILPLGITPVLSFEIVPDVEAVKSKGNSLTETNSKKVCGDKLCSESSDQEKQKYQKTDPVFKDTVTTYNSDNEIAHLEARIAELEDQLMKYKEAEALIQRNLDTFD